MGACKHGCDVILSLFVELLLLRYTVCKSKNIEAILADMTTEVVVKIRPYWSKEFITSNLK